MLSKLASTSTRKARFVDRGPFSEMKHPFLMEDILDFVFPYLPVQDLKSSRLVCKPWNEIGIKFIGRKKLKPIKLSDLKGEDLDYWGKLASENHPKMKLFQGFDITWSDITGTEHHNLLPLFKPSLLVISELSDPMIKLFRKKGIWCTNIGLILEIALLIIYHFMPFFNPNKLLVPGIYPGLTMNFASLLRPVLDTLTDLNLEIKWEKISSNSYSILNDLSSLRMTLKRLKLKIYKDHQNEHYMSVESFCLTPFDHAQRICRILQNLFLQQSHTLEELHLDFKFRIARNEGLERIQLPPFPRLQSLTLASQLFEIDDSFFAQVYEVELFDPINFSLIFPKLTFLNIYLALLFTMHVNNHFHPLKKIILVGNECEVVTALFNELGSRFPFLEELICSHEIHPSGSIPWAQTLRNLEMMGDIKAMDLLHLKKLENVLYEYDLLQEEGEEDIEDLIERLREHYIQLPCLKSFRISMKLSEEERVQIQSALPAEFLDILIIEPSQVLIYEKYR